MPLRSEDTAEIARESSVPSDAPGPAWQSLAWTHWPVVALIVALPISGQRGAFGQVAPQPDRARVDVSILVRPVGDTAARVGLAYRTLVSRERVRQEVMALAIAGGWRVGPDVTIANASLHPDNLHRYPATTAALFTLEGSPQLDSAGPRLLPYLQAFQRWSCVEVMFALPDLPGYTGLPELDNGAVRVQFIKDVGIYRYEVEIKRHGGQLPAMLMAEPATRATSAPPHIRRPDAWRRALAYCLLVLGAGLCIWVGGYMLLARRSVGAGRAPSA